MDIKKNATAGTMESSDTYIAVSPDDKLEITIESVVKHQFYDVILAVVKETLEELQVNKGKIVVRDRGALDCVIRARVETAVKRGSVE